MKSTFSIVGSGGKIRVGDLPGGILSSKKLNVSFRSAQCDAYCNAHFVLLPPVTRFKFWGKILLQHKCISSARTKKPSSCTCRTHWMHLEKEWHASAQIKNAFAFLHLTTWDGEEELLTMQERFPSLWLNKGSLCNKNFDEARTSRWKQMREKARA